MANILERRKKKQNAEKFTPVLKIIKSELSCSYTVIIGTRLVRYGTDCMNNTVPVTVGPLPGGLSGVVIHIVDPTPAGRGFVSQSNYLFSLFLYGTIKTPVLRIQILVTLDQYQDQSF